MCEADHAFRDAAVQSWLHQVARELIRWSRNKRLSVWIALDEVYHRGYNHGYQDAREEDGRDPAARP